ncbi:MAG: hypothetical protein LBS55_03990 [Prevotellaceae bacterium]|nr:hypothetical protein [Prevotellaceae bacterium]
MGGKKEVFPFIVWVYVGYHLRRTPKDVTKTTIDQHIFNLFKQIKTTDPNAGYNRSGFIKLPQFLIDQ